MARDPLILAFDTSAAHCAAALLCGDTVLAARSEEMGRGQAERLVSLLEELLAEAGIAWGDLDRIGVGIGPGNFTGIRISVATARGLALGLGIPAVGVSTFDAIHLDRPEALAAVPAPRGQIYVRSLGALPQILPTGADPGATMAPPPEALAIAMARAAAHAPDTAARPAPLYIRPADAAPAREHGPVMLDDA